MEGRRGGSGVFFLSILLKSELRFEERAQPICIEP